MIDVPVVTAKISVDITGRRVFLLTLIFNDPAAVKRRLKSFW